MIPFARCIIPALMLAAGSGCVTVNSPLFPCPQAPIVLDRACPQSSPQASPSPYGPGTPPLTPSEPLAIPGTLSVPRLEPPASTGGGRLRTGLAGR